MEEIQVPVREEALRYSVPWRPVDHWVGILLLVLVDAALLVAVSQGAGTRLAQNAGLILVQLAYLIPLVVIFAYRRVHPRALGFGGFEWSTLGIGCGLLVASYVIILAHNVILTLIGVDTQGDQILDFWAVVVPPPADGQIGQTHCFELRFIQRETGGSAEKNGRVFELERAVGLHLLVPNLVPVPFQIQQALCQDLSFQDPPIFC